MSLGSPHRPGAGLSPNPAPQALAGTPGRGGQSRRQGSPQGPSQTVGVSGGVGVARGLGNTVTMISNTVTIISNSKGLEGSGSQAQRLDEPLGGGVAVCPCRKRSPRCPHLLQALVTGQPAPSLTLTSPLHRGQGSLPFFSAAPSRVENAVCTGRGRTSWVQGEGGRPGLTHLHGTGTSLRDREGCPRRARQRWLQPSKAGGGEESLPGLAHHRARLCAEPTQEPVTRAVPQGPWSSAPGEGGGWGLFVAFPTQIAEV